MNKNSVIFHMLSYPLNREKCQVFIKNNEYLFLIKNKKMKNLLKLS